jgi:hypothetical protein
MPKVLKFDFCLMTLYEDYMVTNINEGVNLLPEHNDVLVEVANTYYKNKAFVYITHRVNSYSVDPKIYFETSKIENLAGIAVVSEKYKAKSNAELEKMFFQKPFEIFSNIEDAKTWATGLINS